MSTVYHLSPVTQKYSKCTAKVRACRYGSSTHVTQQQYEQVAAEKVHTEQRSKQKINDNLSQTSTVEISVINSEGENVGTQIAYGRSSPFYCKHCRATIDETTYKTMLENPSVEDYPCASCGKNNNWNDCGVDVVEADAKMFDVDNVKQNYWFHVSSKPNWMQDVQESGAEDIAYLPMLHIGSKEAALDRLEHLSLGTKQKWYLYAVKINPKAPIAHNVYDDQNSFPETYGEVYEDETTGYSAEGVTRYVNRYEAPGTISLMANPAAIKIVEVREI